MTQQYKRLIQVILFGFLFFSPVHAWANGPADIRIGALFSLSGWGAQGGTSELNGVILAVDEINGAGGIDGRKIKLVIEDNRSDLRATADAFRKLVSVDKVAAVVGPNWSEFIEVVAPLASQMKIPIVTPSGHSEHHIKPDPWVFVLWQPPAVASRGLSQYIKEQGHKKLSVLISENAYFRGVLQAMQKLLPERGVEILDIKSSRPGEMDFRSEIAKIKASKADSVLALLLETGEFASFLRQRQELKMTLPIFAANTIPFDPTLQKDLSPANGVVYFDYNTPGGEELSTRVQARFNSGLGFGTAKAYDAVFLIAKSVKECGDSSSEIRECLRHISFDGKSGKIEFSTNGLILDQSSNTHLIQVTDGKLVDLPAH